MRNLKQVSEKSKSIKCRDRTTWLPLFYSIKDDAVYTEPGEGRIMVTRLINPNTEKDIQETIENWKRL